MAYSIVNTSHMCRTERPMRLYHRPNDIKPSATTLPANVTFVTDGEIVIGSVKFLRIDTMVSGFDDDTLKGFWTATDGLQVMPIQTTDEPETSNLSDDGISEVISESLVVNGTKIIIYENSDSTEPFIVASTIGNVITVDRRVNLYVNGLYQTRFRIAAIDDNDAADMVGNWILMNYSITINGKDRIIENPVIKPLTSTIQRATLRASSTNTKSGSVNPRRNVSTEDLRNAGQSTDTGIAAAVKDIWNKVISGTSISSNVTPVGSSWVNGPVTDRVIDRSIVNTKIANASRAGSVNPRRGEYSSRNTFGSDSGRLGGFGGSAAVTASVENTYEELFIYNTLETAFMSNPIGSMMFVHGMPFQYTSLTDRRYNTVGEVTSGNENGNVMSPVNSVTDFYGRTFAKEIAANMPIVVVVPGRPKFLSQVSESFLGGMLGLSGRGTQNRNLLRDWIPNWYDDVENALNQLNSDANAADVYQYYSLDTSNAFVEYYNYVNALCQTSAKLMGLEDERMAGGDGTTYYCHQFDWSKFDAAVDKKWNWFQEVVGMDIGVSFAFDPLSAISDSIGNSTGESKFASMMNNISATARELDFLAGSAGVNVDAIDTQSYETAIADLNSRSGLINGARNIASSLSAYLTNSFHGMNVRWPEIWESSNFAHSYSIDMKFIAPYATNFCKWRYVLVPFFHWFAFAAPQSNESIMNYSSPFLVRASSKGYFNVEMGIITGMEWKRFGDGEMISADGVPTEIDVSVTIQDLYQQLSISKFTAAPKNGQSPSVMPSTKAITVFFNNSGLVDLIGTMSGVNMLRIDPGLRVELFAGSLARQTQAIGSGYMNLISGRLAQLANTRIYGI